MSCQPDPFICIKNELKKYNGSLIFKFTALFPAPKDSDHYVLAGGKIIIKGRSVGATTIFNSLIEEDQLKVYFKNTEDFWYRWNRFKKLIIFR